MVFGKKDKTPDAWKPKPKPKPTPEKKKKKQKKQKKKPVKVVDAARKSSKFQWARPRKVGNKWRIPGLRTSTRIFVAIMLIINFFIAQGSLLGGGPVQALFWLFFFNSIIMIWALWKTRRRD